MTKSLKIGRSNFYGLILSLAFSFCCMFTGCATLEQLGLNPPKIDIEDLSLVNATFEQADLAVNVKVINSYPFGATIPGFDYDLKINGTSFLSGNEAISQHLNPFGETTIKVPLSINFIKLYETYSNLKNSDISKYEIIGGVKLTAPLLGEIRIPFQKTGDIPLLKMPKVNVKGLRMKSMNLTSADMVLEIEVDNPNSFLMSLNALKYAFKVNGQDWATGVSADMMSIQEKSESIVKIPISLNFLQIGQTAYSMLIKREPFEYEFNSDFDMGTSTPFLKNVKLPVRKTGRIQLIK